ncbi:MAG TPA: (Fe-S)-binding protein [Casimicrobiaceae bacterium]|nr:(Fe-S)-binding protein [Casimicrobiaceae bacterium]
MSPVGITLALAVAFAGFGVLAWRKLAIVASLAPEVRWNAPGTRWRQVLVDGFLQSRMIRGDRKPGIMHAVIFGGFLTLLLRKVQLIAIGYDETFVYPGLAGGLFAALKDVVEVAVLGAVGYGLWRRFVVRPARLEPNREAVLILGLIAAIMLTDFAFDGFRFARFAATDPGIGHEAAFAPVGRLVAAWVAPLPAGALVAGYHASYWIQMLTVLAFLVLLPVGEHFHIVTALPALFFARGGPANAVPAVDLERVMNAADGEEVAVGARTARDLTWKEALDAFTCTECGRCKDACPTFLTGKPLAHKWVNDSLKHHMLAQRATLVARPAKPDGETLPPLVPEVIGEDTLWSCTTCGYCEDACPIGLEHLPRFFRLRQQRVMMEGAFPHELKPVFEAYESQGNPWGLPVQARGEWAAAAGVPVVSTAEEVAALDWLWYVGSATSYDPRARRIAEAFARVLRAANVRVGILGAGEPTTGECVRRLGNEMLFQPLAEQLVATLNGLGVRRIVTTDPHAFNSLRNESPAFGGHWEVVHHTQLLRELMDQGRLAPAPAHGRVVFHDPCYLGRHNGEYDAPRDVLARVSAEPLGELPLSRAKAMCCGAGGGRMWMEETIGKRINILRTEQVLAAGPAVIATGCPYCTVMLTDGLKALGRDGDVRVQDVAELVAAALPVAEKAT